LDSDMDTLEIVFVNNESSKFHGLHFEWVGRNVNVVSRDDDRIVDSFQFKQEPTYQQVVTACRAYL